jgi:hypothetical protein
MIRAGRCEKRQIHHGKVPGKGVRVKGKSPQLHWSSGGVRVVKAVVADRVKAPQT